MILAFGVHMIFRLGNPQPIAGACLLHVPEDQKLIAVIL